jgi:hypothetical protein
MSDTYRETSGWFCFEVILLESNELYLLNHVA